MILITHDEANVLRDRLGKDVMITITNKQKKNGRKKYYVEETGRVLRVLEQVRTKQVGRGV